MKGNFYSEERGFYEEEPTETLSDWLETIIPVNKQHETLLDSIVNDLKS